VINHKAQKSGVCRRHGWVNTVNRNQPLSTRTFSCVFSLKIGLAGPGLKGYSSAFKIPFTLYDAFAHAVRFQQRVIPMAVPKSKITPSRRGMRRSHDALSSPAYIEDKDSGELRRPHHIDLKSGKYRGRQVLEPQDS